MDTSRHHLGFAVASALVLACCVLGACGGSQPPVSDDPAGAGAASHETWPDAAACDLLPGQAARGGELVLALGEAVTPSHAPVPTNDAERTVFANLYETLTRVTCTGRLMPGLAESWVRHDGGRRWRLRLRTGAVFWDGTPVTSVEVAAAWNRNEDLARATGRPCPGLWLATGSHGLAVIDGRTLEIRLAEPQDQLPRLLAHPALAVAIRRDGWLWPVGSGPCRLAADTDLPLPDLVCRPNLHHPEAPAWDQFSFRILAGSDPRDLLPSGVDLAVIRDRHAAAYYDEIDGVDSAPLPWDRIYILLTPPGASLNGHAAARAISDAACPAESRPWTDLDFHGCRGTACPQLHGPTVGVVAPLLDPDPAVTVLDSRRLYHPADDPDARTLAERVAAFAPDDLDLRPADDASLSLALQQGDAAGYVVRLEACYPTACHTVAALLARADWLQSGAAELADACSAASELTDNDWAIPLIQTRARLVWRSPVVGLRLTHDGALLVAGLGPARLEATP